MVNSSTMLDPNPNIEIRAKYRASCDTICKDTTIGFMGFGPISNGNPTPMPLSVRFVCDSSCEDCAQTLMSGANQVILHCPGKCNTTYAETFSFDIDRLTYGAVMPSSPNFYTSQTYSTAARVDSNTARISPDRAYPFDTLLFNVMGHVNKGLVVTDSVKLDNGWLAKDSVWIFGAGAWFDYEANHHYFRV